MSLADDLGFGVGTARVVVEVELWLPGPPGFDFEKGALGTAARGGGGFFFWATFYMDKGCGLQTLLEIRFEASTVLKPMAEVQTQKTPLSCCSSSLLPF